MLISLIMVIISQCTHIRKHCIVYLKYMQVLASVPSKVGKKSTHKANVVKH